MRANEIREPVVAGQFYPGQATQLQGAIERFLKTPPASLPGALRALIVPHAGYSYSEG